MIIYFDETFTMLFSQGKGFRDFLSRFSSSSGSGSNLLALASTSCKSICNPRRLGIDSFFGGFSFSGIGDVDADVAASTNPTGASSLGGDWVLEYSTSGIEAEALSLTNYDSLLGFAADDHNGDGIADPIRMITWNVIGLDSNDPENSGPNKFMVGFRVSADAAGFDGYTAKIVALDGTDLFGTGFTIGDSDGSFTSDIDDGVDDHA